MAGARKAPLHFAVIREWFCRGRRPRRPEYFSIDRRTVNGERSESAPAIQLFCVNEFCRGARPRAPETDFSTS